MAEQMKPASNAEAPDPSNNYERSHPEREAGLGSLDTPIGGATPADQADKGQQAVKNKQEPRQINADEETNARADAAGGNLADKARPGDGRGTNQPLPGQHADHSMKDEEPLGWDQAPTDIHDPRQQRHPKTDGKGGTP